MYHLVLNYFFLSHQITSISILINDIFLYDFEYDCQFLVVQITSLFFILLNKTDTLVDGISYIHVLKKSMTVQSKSNIHAPKLNILNYNLKYVFLYQLILIG